MDQLQPQSSSSTALTIPSQPQRSLNRQIVLEEEEYTEALSSIIARDFFPSLATLDATNNYLTALESQDSAAINASVRRLADLATAPTPTPRMRADGQTPYVNFPSDTPLRTPRPSAQAPTKKMKYDPTLSLDAFQARYTSEDNASFTEILDDENKKRKEKHAWAWNAEDRAGARRHKEIESRERMMIEAGAASGSGSGASGRKAIAGSAPKAITQSGSEGTDASQDLVPGPFDGSPMEVDDDEVSSEPAVESTSAAENVSGQLVRTNPPQETEEVDVMAPVKDKRSAGVHGWKFKTRNALMFPPDADESPYQAPSSSAGSVTADPKIINHANTRLPEQSEGLDGSHKTDAPPSPTGSRIAAAISGTPYVSRSDSPKIAGFGFVDAIPSPSPSQLGPRGVKELMTLGTLLATPRVISRGGSDDTSDPADAVPSPFVINPPNARDSLGRRLGSEAGRSLSKKAGLLTPKPGARGTSSSGREKLTALTPRRVDVLTPAARRLLDRTKGGPLSGSPLGSSGRKGGLLGGVTPLLGDGGRRAGKQQLDLRKVGWGDSPRVMR